jgi:hypothetical protein
VLVTRRERPRPRGRAQPDPPGSTHTDRVACSRTRPAAAPSWRASFNIVGNQRRRPRSRSTARATWSPAACGCPSSRPRRTSCTISRGETVKDEVLGRRRPQSQPYPELPARPKSPLTYLQCRRRRERHHQHPLEVRVDGVLWHERPQLLRRSAPTTRSTSSARTTSEKSRPSPSATASAALRLPTRASRNVRATYRHGAGADVPGTFGNHHPDRSQGVAGPHPYVRSPDRRPRGGADRGEHRSEIRRNAAPASALDARPLRLARRLQRPRRRHRRASSTARSSYAWDEAIARPPVVKVWYVPTTSPTTPI